MCTTAQLQMGYSYDNEVICIHQLPISFPGDHLPSTNCSLTYWRIVGSKIVTWTQHWTEAEHLSKKKYMPYACQLLLSTNICDTCHDRIHPNCECVHLHVIVLQTSLQSYPCQLLGWSWTELTVLYTSDTAYFVQHHMKHSRIQMDKG